MPTTSCDTIYQQFLKEAREEDLNFYFVKQFDPELYEQLCNADSNAVLNLRSAGNALRGALEHFMTCAMPQEYLDEVYQENAFRKRIARSRTGDMVDYEKVFSKHKNLNVDATYFKIVREAGNEFSHDPKENRANRKDTYVTLCAGLDAMHTMLHKFFTKEDPALMRPFKGLSYDRNKQPFGDKLVCAAISTCDSTACERQILCSRKSERLSSRPTYCLLRVYRASDTSAGAIRDEKVLSNLWESSLRSMPNIVRYSPLNVIYKGARPGVEKKHIISYDFGAFKPFPLHTELLSKLDQKQKLMIMHDIATGLKVLHMAGIYHRNLQPNSVYVFFDRNSSFVQAKLVGFEYAKIEGENATVFASVANRMEKDPSVFFSLTMQQGLRNAQIAKQLDWSREDIYSLGALFSFILTGAYPDRIFNPQQLQGQADSELIALIQSMTSLNTAVRPDIHTVLNYLKPKYEALL
jgi:hypothetical protein